MEQKIKINCVIGIDPGASGGIAVFIPGNPTMVAKMPKEIRDLADFFAYYAENFKPIIFLEKLSVRPDDIKADENGKTNMGKLFRVQKMMANFEHLKALIEISGIPYVMVHPRKWMSYLGLIVIRKQGPKETKQERKNRLKDYAAKNYPQLNVTLWNADAINIMHFARKVLVNELSWVRANLPVKEHSKLF